MSLGTGFPAPSEKSDPTVTTDQPAQLQSESLLGVYANFVGNAMPRLIHTMNYGNCKSF